MIPVKLASFQHELKEVITYIESKIVDFNSLEGALEDLLKNEPSARDFMAVDEFFHELRNFQFEINKLLGSFKAALPVFHIFALKNVDPETYKKVKTSTTNTLKLYESYTAKLVEVTVRAEGLIKLIESTSIQYNTLISALKRGV